VARDCDAETIERVLERAILVHKTLGPGLLESVYEAALAYELTSAGLEIQTQVPIPVLYRGIDLGTGFRADIIVAGELILEIKSIRGFDASHVTQLLTYLRLTGIRTGLLLNFNARLMKDGIRRVSDFSSSP
jgi:GxxExxY protein